MQNEFVKLMRDIAHGGYTVFMPQCIKTK